MEGLGFRVQRPDKEMNVLARPGVGKGAGGGGGGEGDGGCQIATTHKIMS